MTTEDNAYGPGPFKVSTGVHGASRIVEREYVTIEEAKARAERWSRSNSIGSYWAQVHNADGQLVSQSTRLVRQHDHR